MEFVGNEFEVNEEYMAEAFKEAHLAYEMLETPIGCVIEYQGKIIGRGHNERNKAGCALRHAEISAIAEASRFMGDWRLEDCTLYVTLEPCPMCAGAIVQARIPRVVISAMNPKAGCAGSVLNLLREPGFNHRCDMAKFVMEEEGRELMSGFFRELRRMKAEDEGKEISSVD